jgi:hypothetical protein
MPGESTAACKLMEPTSVCWGGLERRRKEGLLQKGVCGDGKVN